MSLEVAPRNDLPIVPSPDKEANRYQNEQQMDNNALPVGDHTSNTSPRQHDPQKRTLFLLSTALAVMTVLAVVAAAVGGSVAVERKHEIDRLNELLDDRSLANTTAIPDSENSTSSFTPSIASATASTSAPIATSTYTHYDPFKDTIKPGSNCSAMGSTYISVTHHEVFNIYCQRNYPGSDMLSVWVFTFADCIEACARCNFYGKTPRCYAVSYSRNDSRPEWSGYGNCWLKDSNDLEANSETLTDSGVLEFDS